MTMLWFAPFCRFCMANEKVIDAGICDENNISYCTKIAEIIPQYLNYLSDDFPTMICWNCQKKLDLFYKFIKDSEKAHELLQKYYSKLISGSNDSDIVYSLNINVDENLQDSYSSEDSLCHNIIEETNLLPKTVECNTKIDSSNFGSDENKFSNVAAADVNLDICIKVNQNTVPGNIEANTAGVPFNLVTVGSIVTEKNDSLIEDEDINDPNMNKEENKLLSVDCSIENSSSNSVLPKNVVKQEYDHLSSVSDYEDKVTLSSNSHPEITTEKEINEKQICHSPNLIINSKQHQKKDIFIDDSLSNICKTEADLNIDIIDHKPLINSEFVNINNLNSIQQTTEIVNSKDNDFSSDICTDIIGNEVSTNNSLNEITDDDDYILEEKKNYSCDICGKNFKDRKQRNKHRKIHTTERPFECDICGKKFAISKYLKSHKRIHVDEKPYECEICNKKFLASYLLNVHMRVHTGEKPFECDICKGKFSASSTLRNHKRLHTGNKPHKCDLCPMQFIEKRQLFCHVQKVHKNECKVCNMQFEDLPTLLLHRRVHSEYDKKFECDICKKKFIKIQHLRRHQWIHRKDNPFTCDICQQKHTSSYELRLHKRRKHSTDRPYACTVCPKRFADPRCLLQHSKIHMGEKPHKCDNCDKKFGTAAQLKSHKRVHTDEKPYTCNICLEKFKYTGSLSFHRRKTHGQKSCT